MKTSAANHQSEYVVIITYLLLMMAIGFIFRRFNKNISDYFRSGSQGTWWLVGTSSFMGSVSAVTFTGYGGAAFKAGWSILAIYLGNAVGLMIQALVLAPLFRQMRATTFPEVIRERFGPVTQQFYAYMKLFTFTLYASLWLLGLAVFSSSIFDLSVHAVIPALGAVALFYPMLGGKWAVMAADFVKGLIMMSVTILLSVYCLKAVGGFSGLTELIQTKGLADDYAFIKVPGQFPNELYTCQWVLSVFLISVIVNCGMGNAVKFFAVKDGREARWAAGLSAALMFAGALFWFIPPMTARLLFESEVMLSGLAKPEEAAIAVISTKLLPAGLLGMMVVAMFSATMSAMDVGINGNAAVVVKDIIPSVFRLRRRELPSEAAQLWLGKIATLAFGVIIIALAIHLSRQKGAGIFELMLSIGSILGVPITIPTVLCMFVRKVPAWSALFSIGAGLLPSLLAHFNPATWSFQERTLWSIAAGTAAFLLTRLFWQTSTPEYRERVDRFFTRMHRPVDFEKEIGMASDGRQLLLIGRLSLVVAVFVLCLLVIQNPWEGRVAIAALSAVIGAVGLLLILAGGRHNRAAAKKT